MARVKGIQKIVGSFANASFYTIQGGEQVYVRIKGGPSKRAIKTKPQFEKLRRNNSEWSACAKMGSNLRTGYYYLRHLEDYPIIGSLNAIAKKIQKMDEEGEHGHRSIYLSRHKDLLGGINLSKKQVFESVLRVPVSVTLDRGEAKPALIHVPSIDTRMYLYNFRNLPFFYLLFCLGGVQDMVYNETEKKYSESTVYIDRENGIHISDWHSTNGVIPELNIELLYVDDPGPVPEDFTLVFTVGLEFGTQGVDGNPEGVKYAGCGKIMRVM
jgi:hypothetical protein